MNTEEKLRERLLSEAMKYSVDDVGFGPVERFADEPVLKIFDRAKTVICLSFRVLRGSLRGVEEGSTYYQYSTTGVETIEETMMPMALLKLSGIIEDAGFLAVPQKNNQLIMGSGNQTNPEMLFREIYHGKDAEPQLDFKHCAVLCGVGEAGLNGSVLTPENGPFQRFCFILTDAVIEGTPLRKPTLCDGCLACVNACPGHAISKEGKTDSWQCAAYYQGASKAKNPFMPEDAYEDLEDREAVMNGTAVLSPEEAQKVLDRTMFYPPIKHGYTSSICGRACDRACYAHLEETGKLHNAFRTPFRKRPEWTLS